ncbi:MAG: DedA family protein [Gammaproteobacteria bacterium]|jgi:membrane protein DedA with SNARE-associated domain|nr:DedA family protein [Gammaproteobacteria bacterium]MBU2065724.1 DedA family protein [Gammaproteobacteria bacterium]MBU2140513.1 DedA family protein [Gammaproteobacteria bacterium]MBU2217605.1 DedA family protein [Gammaproteobacteria bacterium]
MLEAFLQHFGYPAVFLGAFLEGEMSLVLAAYLALRGYLEIEPVMILAFLGTYASDQFWYFLGRRHGRRILARRPRWQALADKTLPLVRRHPDLWVLCFRFIYGLRTVMPVALGLTGYPWGRYLVLTAIGAGLWAAALGLAAYHIGAALEALLGDMRDAQLLLLGALVLLGISLWLYRRMRRSQD